MRFFSLSCNPKIYRKMHPLFYANPYHIYKKCAKIQGEQVGQRLQKSRSGRAVPSQQLGKSLTAPALSCYPTFAPLVVTL
jgi:hypothetical protein